MRTHFFHAWILLFFITAQLHAQDVKVEWSAPYTGYYDELVVEESQIYFSEGLPSTYSQGRLGATSLGYGSEFADVQISMMDYSLKRTCGSALAKPSSFPYAYACKFFPRNDKLLVYAKTTDKKPPAMVLSMKQMPQWKEIILQYDNCKLNPKVTNLDEMTAKSGMQDYNSDMFETNRKDRIVLFMEERYDKEAQKKQQGILLLDDNLNQIYTAKIEVDAKNSTIVSKIFVLDNDDVIAIMSDARGIQQTYIQIHQFSKEGTGKSKKVELTEVSDLRGPASGDEYHLLSDGNIGWAGFYTKKSAVGGSAEGAFYVKINIETGSKEFAKFFLLTDLNEIFKTNAMLHDGLSLHKILWTTEDAIIFITRKWRVNQSNEIISIELLLTKLNPQGSYKWTTVIPKEQLAKARSTSSVGMQMHDNKVYLLFNASPSRTETAAKTTKNNESSQAMLAVVDENGKLTRTPLYSNASDEFVTIPALFSKGSNPGEFILMKTGAGPKYKIGKLQVN